ncbi:MAG: hypothetical protein AABZ60_23355 [Planctomycetota bacterium]
MRLTIPLWLFFLAPLFAHFDTLPNNKINAWDKLVLEVSYDEETGVISIRGHSHHPNGVTLLLTLRNLYEKDLIERQDVSVQNGLFSHTFGPFVTPEQKPAPGYYEITVWFIHKQQKPEMQQMLNQTASDFYNCSPPCPIDYQHYQQDIVQIGTEEEIEAEFKGSIKKYEEFFDRAYEIEKEAKRYLSKLIRSKQNWEAVEAEYVQKRDDFMAQINKLAEEVEELRRAKSLLYFNKVLSSIQDPLTNLLQEFSKAKKVMTGMIKDPKKVEEVLKGLELYDLKDMKKKLKASIQEQEDEKEEKKH